VFSTRKPKDIIAGTSSGLKSIGKGVIGGLSAAIGGPILGAKEGGIKGFGLGLIGGVIGGVGLIGTGLGVGVYQIGRGIFNTPEAVHESCEGKEWDTK